MSQQLREDDDRVPQAESEIEGESEDFAGWVAPHLVVMANFASRLVGAADRDDLVQDALMRAWRRHETFDGRRGSARSWLLAVVADQARQRRRRWVRSGAGESSPVEPAVRAGASGASVVDSRLDLDVAMGRLARRQRRAIDLYYFVGLDVADTAAVMGCSVGTVKSTLADARSRLRSELENDHGH